MFTVQFYSRNFQNRQRISGLQFQVESFSFTAVGGCSEARLRVTGNEQSLLFGLLNYLRAPIEIFDEQGLCVWWGLVHSTTIYPPGIGLTLDGFANRVRVAYSTPTIADIASVRGTTDWLDDTNSQNLYGVREYTDTLNDMVASSANQRRAIVLAQRAAPLPITELSGDASSEQYAIVNCRGWIDTLDWRNYSRARLVQYYDSATAKVAWQAFGITRDMPQYSVGYVAMPITTTINMSVDNITVGIQTANGVRNLRITLYSGYPWAGGTVVAQTAYYQYNTLPAAGSNGLISFPFITPVYVAAGTPLWIHFEGHESLSGVEWQNRFQLMLLEEASGNIWVEYPAGAWKTRQSTGLPKANLRYDLNGILDTSQIVSEAITSHAEFITGVDIKNTSGILLATYRDGETSLMRIVQELMDTGTTNFRRLLLTITRDRVAQIYEESAGSAANPDLLMTLDGKLWDARKQPIGAKSPVGKWVKIIGTPLSDALSNPPHFFFIERATYDVARSSWQIEPRGSDAAFVARIA